MNEELMDTALVTTTQEIKIAFPDATNRHLKLAVGACRLNIRPGDGQEWVRGTYDAPPDSIPLIVKQESGTLHITQKVQDANFLNYGACPAALDLALGKDKPYALTLETGASDCVLDLGGVPLTHLSIKHGADQLEMDFSAPNPQSLRLFEMSSGAGSTTIKHLGNANLAEMKVDGGAAAFVLDFDGILQQDAHVSIHTAMAGVEISIPRTTAARITTDAFFGGLTVSDGFTKQNGVFMTQPALQGTSPTLSIKTNVAFGSVQLQAI
jgi:hypothetical protein